MAAAGAAGAGRTEPVIVTKAQCSESVPGIENLPGPSSLIGADGRRRSKELLTVALEKRGSEAGK